MTSRLQISDWRLQIDRTSSPVPRSAIGNRQSTIHSRLTFYVLRFALCAFLLALLLPALAHAETRVVRLIPEAGSTKGGTVVRIYVAGAGLVGPVEVYFGDRAAAKVRRLSLTALEAVTPPGALGPATVRILNALWGTEVRPAVFTYVPTVPQITRVDPGGLRAGADGSEIRIDGSDFTPTAVVVVNDTALPTVFVAPDRLQAQLPAALLASPRSLTLRVTDTVEGEATSDPVTVAVVNPSPRITGVDVPPLDARQPVAALIVRGADFRPDSQIELAGQATPTRYRSVEELEGALPVALLNGTDRLSLRVVTPGPGGGISNPWTLAVVSPPAPPTPPAPPPIPGRFVVFTSNRSGARNHIYLLDRQTKRLDALEEANNPLANDAYPAISADGRFIVFQSDRHRSQLDIFLFDREARTLDPLPEANHPTAFDGFPSISADGRVIVFESDRLNGKPKIFVFDREQRTLSELGGANEATAEDGLAAISN